MGSCARDLSVPWASHWAEKVPAHVCCVLLGTEHGCGEVGQYILNGVLSRHSGEPMEAALSGGVGVAHVTSVPATSICEVSGVPTSVACLWRCSCATVSNILPLSLILQLRALRP